MTDPHEMTAALVRQDDAARERALDTTASFIVQAPAGSGKTELLIQRYLSLLATVDAPEEIIAITFTRKAATEMRVRILQAIGAADAAEASTEHARRTQMLARAALRRDRERGWSIGEQPGRLRILTIDALNGWIARQMPWLSGLGPVSAVTDDADILYREAVRSVLIGQSGGSRIRAAVRQLLIHLDNRFRSVEDLLVEMLAIRDQWIELLAGGLETRAARVLLESTLRRIIEAHLARLRAKWEPDVLEEVLLLAAHASSVLDGVAERSPGALSAGLDYSVVPGETEDDIPLWLAIRQLLLTEGDEFRKPRGITVRMGFAANDPMKDRLKSVLEQIAGDEGLRALLAGIRALPAPGFDHGQWEIVGSMVAILEAVTAELRSLFARRGATDHIEVANAARRALGDELAPTDLSMLLEYRIRHLLVDEFQDTSSTQFLLLRQLTAGWSAPDQHTLFLVGDPMQSIYRFREAEVGLFLNVWQQERLGSVPLTALRLLRNFRSQQRIVDWINDSFSTIMPENSDAASGAVAYAASAAVHEAEESAVDLHITFSGDRNEEARAVTTYVQRVLAGEVCGRVESLAVLVRARTHLAQLVPVLRAAGLRFRAVEIESLGKNSAVQDILALTRAVLYPSDRIAWLAVLRAPFCGVTLADLHTLCRDDLHTPLASLLEDPVRRSKMSTDGRDRAERLLAAVSEASAQRGRMSLRRLIETCWISLGAPSLLDASSFDAAMAFLALLEQHEAGGEVDDLTLLEQSASLLYAPPDPEGDPRLQLMTVHKAKGLQFDVVVLPRLDGVPRQDSERLLLWDRSLGEEGLSFLIAPVRERGGDTDPIYDFIRNNRAVKADHEYLRMLYVAATRAKRRLFLSATMKESTRKGERVLNTPRPRSFLSYLWPLLEGEIDARYRTWTSLPLGEEESGGGSGGAQVLFQRVTEGWTAPAVPAFPTAGPSENEDGGDKSAPLQSDLEWRAGHSARAAGVVVHALLQRIAEHGEKFWKDAGGEDRGMLLNALFSDAGLTDPPQAAVERAAAAIDRILADERGRWLLAAQEEGECELALTGWDGDAVSSVKIDRTFVDADGVRWVVDYKTATHEGADLEAFLKGQEALYRPQIERYARMIAAWDDRPVRAALYFPLLQRWKEVPLLAAD